MPSDEVVVIAASDEALIDKVARAMMDVCAARPGGDPTEYPILDLDPDFDDLPEDHTEGTTGDPITREAVRRLARAAVTICREHFGV